MNEAIRIVSIISLVTYMIFVTIPTIPTNLAFERMDKIRYLLDHKPGYPQIALLNQDDPRCRAYLVDLEGYRLYCDFEVGGCQYGPDSVGDLYGADDPWEWLTERGYDYLLITNMFYYDNPIELPREHFRRTSSAIAAIRVYRIVK